VVGISAGLRSCSGPESPCQSDLLQAISFQGLQRIQQPRPVKTDRSGQWPIRVLNPMSFFWWPPWFASVNTWRPHFCSNKPDMRTHTLVIGLIGCWRQTLEFIAEPCLVLAPSTCLSPDKLSIHGAQSFSSFLAQHKHSATKTWTQLLARNPCAGAGLTWNQHNSGPKQAGKTQNVLPQ